MPPNIFFSLMPVLTHEDFAQPLGNNFVKRH
jgi:hypothetical protein